MCVFCIVSAVCSESVGGGSVALTTECEGICIYLYIYGIFMVISLHCQFHQVCSKGKSYHFNAFLHIRF